MKLTLTYVGRFTTKKDGSPLIGKNGRPYTSLRIKANEYGDRYISGFDSKETKDWKIGDTVEAEVEEKGEYLNLSVPRTERGGIPTEELQKIHLKLDAIWTRLGVILGKLEPEKIPGTSVSYPTADDAGINPEDVPF